MHRLGLLMFLAVLAGGFAWPQTSFAQEEKTLEERMDEIDVTDPDQLQEVAAWAIKHKNSKVRKEGRKLMKEVLELDEEHEAARAALGHVLVGGKWYKSKKKAEKAKLAMLAKEMKERGYVKHKNGFIKKTDKRKWKKNWEKGDDLIWISYEDVMRGKGYALYEGEWLRVSAQDAKRAKDHTTLTGEDILIVSSEHFIFHFQIPVKLVKRYTELVEQVYAWMFKEFQFDQMVAMDQLFPRKPHIWGFSSPQQLLDWVTAYSEDYKFTKEDKELYRKRVGGRLDPGRLLCTIVNEKPEDMENSIIHQAAVLIFEYFVQFKASPWLYEAVANLAEHLHSKDKQGVVSMSTNVKYDNAGGIAKKEFNTKDAPPQVKGLVKRADDIAMHQLSLLGLNDLNQDHLAQGYSHVEWMYHNSRGNMVKWFHHLRRDPFIGRPKLRKEANAFHVTKCIQHAYGWSEEEYMKEWRVYVKKNYR